jgi:S-adenosylmethionine hydrolase
MNNKCITLTTDFGLKDGYVGAMKGVLTRICPEARLVDISHNITPQNVLEGSLVLSRAYSYFPAGTVHLAVVDPGVGTNRRPIAAQLGDHYFVGPDNGLFTPILEEVEKKGGKIEMVLLKNPKLWLPEVSLTFHGRDIFAPAAANLARGIPLAEFGPAIEDPIRMTLPKPERTEKGWRAHIVSIDHFGNLATDLPVGNLFGAAGVLVQIRGRMVRGLAQSYGQGKTGDLLVLVNSQYFIEIAVVNGSAAEVLGASVGELIEVFIQSKVE